MGNLTKQEKIVSTEISLGKKNKEIAETLGITEKGVKFHASNIYKKLGIKSRWELMSINKTEEEKKI